MPKNFGRTLAKIRKDLEANEEFLFDVDLRDALEEMETAYARTLPGHTSDRLKAAMDKFIAIGNRRLQALDDAETRH